MPPSEPPTVAAFQPPDPAPLAATVPVGTLERVRQRLRDKRLEGAKDNGFEEAGFDAALPLSVQARMRFAGKPSLTGPDLGLALLVTRSCGAAQPPPPKRGWFRW